MADPRNKAPKESSSALADPALVRHERLTLYLFLEGGVAIVAGMIVLSEFLSRGNVDRMTGLIASVLGILFAVGFGITYMLRRRGAK